MQKYIYLDTNAFEFLAESKKAIGLFKNWINKKDIKIVISSATVSELSRKYNKFSEFNSFINDTIFSFLFLGRYSSLTELEKKYYPHLFDIEEVSLNEDINQRLAGKPFDFNEIKNNINFENALNSQINAAGINFPNTIINWFFQNPPKNKNYTTSEKERLKQKIFDNAKARLSTDLNTKEINLDYFKTDMVIIEFLFKKHLIQPIRNLRNSDFVDIQHVAYSPYMTYFITEKNNYDILKQIKKTTNLLDNTTIIKLTEFETFLNN